MAEVASRNSLVGALLRNSAPANRHSIFNFLRGLSRDELECLAEFQGACILEWTVGSSFNPYRLMADFFDPDYSGRWTNSNDRAHKTFVVLAYLDLQDRSISVKVKTERLNAV